MSDYLAVINALKIVISMTSRLSKMICLPVIRHAARSYRVGMPVHYLVDDRAS